MNGRSFEFDLELDAPLGYLKKLTLTNFFGRLLLKAGLGLIGRKRFNLVAQVDNEDVA